jgi:pimeloyl-ACP methyl ester carboxylesterase
MFALVEKGFESWAIRSSSKSTEYLDKLGSIDDEINALVEVMKPPFSSPPVIIAHGLGAFVAQKYLESYAAAGLVLVSPFPPNPSNALCRLKRELIYSPRFEADSSYRARVEAESDPSALLTDAALPSSILNLEPLGDFLDGVLILTTRSDPVVTSQDILDFKAWNHFSDLKEQSIQGEETHSEQASVIASHVSLKGQGGHLTMIDPCWEEEGGLQEKLVSWIDEKF